MSNKPTILVACFLSELCCEATGWLDISPVAEQGLQEKRLPKPKRPDAV